MKAAIIQARIDSGRLPKKVLKKINKKPLIEYVIKRVKLAKKIDKVVLAIPKGKKDDVLLEIARRLGVDYIRGSTENVLSRYLKASEETKADIIVRITGDCPLIDPEIIDEMIDDFEKNKCDYLSNDANYGGHPRGLDVDIFFTDCLKKVSELADKDYYKEHVTTFMLDHPEMFKIRNYKSPQNLYRPNYRLCVDEKADLVLVKKIFEHFKPKEDFTAQEIIEYLDENPKIASINKNVKQRK